MSAGPSLYRRHRPRTFADVVGQEHVVRTLSHAVERDKVHHAYLFVGSRGTGKTSMAKILASCLNCVDGPTITPCGVCDSCVSIASATSLDVIEMDAASNNSVDDIRELRETVAFAPVSGRHKVYILDEAHMLSSAAWNAFLKTLEEPPPRTVFVLATTEAQKVLPTVVDRCHRFDFGRPGADQVAGLLRRVADREGIALEDGAAALVARHATGSYRDALGTLEQLVDYAGDVPITATDVLAVLGVADSEALFGALEAVIARDPGAALGAAGSLCGSGRDPGQVLRDLESHARELLTVQVIGRVPPELSITRDRDERLAEQAARLAPTDAVRLLDLISGALEASQNGAHPRIQLELVLIRAAAPEFDPTSSALLSRLERLERGSVISAVPAPQPSTPAAAAFREPLPAPTAPPPSAEVAEARVEELAPAAPEAEAVAPLQPEPEPAPAVPVAPAPAAPVGAHIAELWPAVVEIVRGQNELLAALLKDARPSGATGETLTLALPVGAQFQKRKLEGNDEYRQIATAAVRSVTGASLNLVWELATDAEVVAAAGAATLSEDELVRRLVEDFDAQELTDQET